MRQKFNACMYLLKLVCCLLDIPPLRVRLCLLQRAAGSMSLCIPCMCALVHHHSRAQKGDWSRSMCVKAILCHKINKTNKQSMRLSKRCTCGSRRTVDQVGSFKRNDHQQEKTMAQVKQWKPVPTMQKFNGFMVVSWVEKSSACIHTRQCVRTFTVCPSANIFNIVCCPRTWSSRKVIRLLWLVRLGS
jgi:hypothetical protein